MINQLLDQVVHADSILAMKTLPENVVHLILSDIPSNF
jgi:DNA modification methylase